MARPASKHPTEFELEILKILWRTGPASARTVVDALDRDLAYTSVVTIMNVMARKGYVQRVKQKADARSGVGGGYVYKPLAAEGKTVGSMLRDLVSRAFGNSPANAALQLLETSDLSAEEMAKIRELLERKDRSKQ